MSNSRLLTGKVKKVYGDRLTVDRYNNLSLSQAEPDLGPPSVDGSILIGSTSSNVRQWSPIVSVGTQTVLILSTTSNRFSNQPQALDVKGGAVIRGNLHVGGTAYLNDAEILTTSSGLTSVLGNSVINQILKVNTTTNAVSTNTGALQVLGGVGIGGNLYVGGFRNTSTSLIVYYNTTTGELSYSEVTGGAGGVGGTGSPFAGIFTITNTTTAISTVTGALQVAGGVGIQGDLFVGGTAYLNNAEVLTTSSRITSVEGLTQVTQDFIINTSTNATSPNTGALQVVGGVGIGLDVSIGGKVRIESTLSSTTTVANNALYVAGGVGIGKSLLVTGEATFLNNVVFAGDSTYVYSTSTLYTDNFIDLHFPAGQGDNDGVWAVDDGKDIGHIYHHYKADTGDEHGALIWHNESDELRWYMGGVDYVGGSQVWNFNTATLGVFRTGSIRLTNATSATSTTTGALTVAGGVGIVGDLHIGGSLYQNGEQIGVRGYTGSQGDTGFTGSRGFSGFVGSVGFTGSGGTGYTGSQGDTGYTGSQGVPGTAGTGGSAGATGFTGSIGYTGSKGDMGYTGPIGYTGSGGYTGSEGRFGYTGSKGEKGDNATGGASTVLERHYRKPGILTQAPGTEKWYVPVDSIVTSARSRVEIAPQGAQPLTVAIKINGISTATLSINSGTTISSLSTATINLRTNDYVTVDVLNIGNTVAGSDLTVTFTYIRNI
jgi:hypothetical protein